MIVALVELQGGRQEAGVVRRLRLSGRLAARPHGGTATGRQIRLNTRDKVGERHAARLVLRIPVIRTQGGGSVHRDVKTAELEREGRRIGPRRDRGDPAPYALGPRELVGLFDHHAPRRQRPGHHTHLDARRARDQLALHGGEGDLPGELDRQG